MENSFEKLTAIQTKVGYAPGQINIIALLGLFGEAGEVLNEVALLERNGQYGVHEKFKQLCVNMAEIMDDHKKHLRDKKNAVMTRVHLDPDRENNFDKEISNVLYYLNCLAINRGKDLNFYAELAVKICLEKSQKDISHGTVNKETYNPEL